MRQLKHYPKYLITESGEVWTTKYNRFLNIHIDKNGYKKFSVTENYKTVNLSVHRQVALAYLEGNEDESLNALHKDGNKLNCHFSNLYWGTKSHNALDSIDHGTFWQKNKTRCPLGHLLEEPNIVLSRVAKGHRSCRSCSNAMSYAFTHKEHSYEYYADNIYYPRYMPVDSLKRQG